MWVIGVSLSQQMCGSSFDSSEVSPAESVGQRVSKGTKPAGREGKHQQTVKLCCSELSDELVISV